MACVLCDGRRPAGHPFAVLGALKTLHHGSAVPRDVSLDNIFLQDSGPPVLLDLGAARTPSAARHRI